MQTKEETISMYDSSSREKAARDLADAGEHLRVSYAGGGVTTCNVCGAKQ